MRAATRRPVILWFERAANRYGNHQEPLRRAARLLAELGSFDEARILDRTSDPIHAFRSVGRPRSSGRVLHQTGNPDLAADIEARLPGYQVRERTRPWRQSKSYARIDYNVRLLRRTGWISRGEDFMERHAETR